MSSKPGKITLTDEEVSFQREMGMHYRKLMTQSVKDFLSHVKDKNKVGIFLSGGVDSTTVLWALLEQGVRPYCYTFNFPTNSHLPGDALKARILAEKYRLPFHIIEMPKDPDELAQLIFKINEESDHGLGRRPDFEVLPVFYKMTEYARDNDGVTDIFSGIGDSMIHLLGRTNEIEGRSGLMTPLYTDYKRMVHAPDPQLIQIIKMMSRQGSRILLPLTTTAMMNPYFGVPWKLMNVPRLKQITIGAWSREEELSEIRAVVSPLQNGDTNGRGYYDTLIARSQFVMQYLGKQTRTAQVFYNALMRSRGLELRNDGKSNVKYDEMWFRYAADGVALSEEYYILERELMRKGIISDPEQSAGDNLFGDLFGGEEEVDETPEGDIPEGVYQVSASHHYEGVYCLMEKCAIDMVQYLGECSQASASGPREVFAHWQNLAENNFKNLRQIRTN